MRRLFWLCVVLSLPAVCRADSDDETLVSWLKKSDLVVVAELKSSDVAFVNELIVVSHFWDVEVKEIIKGNDELKGKTVSVEIVRFDEGDGHPLIKKNTVCILFLRANQSGNIPKWVTADVWFGIQPASKVMTRSMVRLLQSQ